MLLDDADLAARMGRESRAMAERDYAEDRWKRDWVTEIDKFVSRDPPKAGPRDSDESRRK